MSYNPDIHKRKSIRLKGYDYSKNGAYFITICCHDNLCRFGKIENKKIILNKYGKIAHNEWKKLSSRFQNIKTDIFQIMPNHFHAILVLENNNVGVGLAPTLIKNNINVSIFQSGQPQGIAPTR